ncbi:MAG: T9SS type A sorting domain-containing protein [bacterium]
MLLSISSLTAQNVISEDSDRLGNDFGDLSWNKSYQLDAITLGLANNYNESNLLSGKGIIDYIISMRDDKRGVVSYINSDFQPCTLKTWRSLKYTGIERNDTVYRYDDFTGSSDFLYGYPKEFYAYPNVSAIGRIVSAMLEFVYMVDSLDNTGEIWSVLGQGYRDSIIKICEEAFAEEDKWFVEDLSEEMGWYIYKTDVLQPMDTLGYKIDKYYPEIHFLQGSIYANGKQCNVGNSAIYLHLLTNNSKYFDKTYKISNFIKERLCVLDSTYVWSYSGYYDTIRHNGDDVSHGTWTVKFIEEFYARYDPLTFTVNDINLLTGTLLRNIWRPDTLKNNNEYVFYTVVDGPYNTPENTFDFSEGNMYRYWELSKYNPYIHEILDNTENVVGFEEHKDFYSQYYKPFAVDIKIGEMPVMPEDSQQIDVFSDMVYVELKSLNNYTGKKDTIIVELYDPDNKAEYHLTDTLYDVIAGRTYNVSFDYLVFDGETLTTDTLVAKAYALRKGVINCPFLTDTLPLVARDTIYMFNTNELPVLKNNSFNVYTSYRNKNLDMFGIDSVKVTVTYDTITDMGQIEKATMVAYTDSNGRAQFDLRTETTYPVIINAEKVGYFAKTDTIKPYMWSTTSDALGPNSSNHLIKQGSILHLSYSDGDSIVYGKSKDFGITWELTKISRGKDVCITAITGGMAAVWKDGETWQYAYTTSPWIEPIIPSVMGYRNPSIITNPANMLQIWFAGITTDHLTVDNQWTLEYNSFMYNDLVIPEFTQLIGEAGEYDYLNNYLVKPYNLSSIGINTRLNKIAPMIVFEDINGEIIRKKYFNILGWQQSENVSNSSAYSFNPSINPKSLTDTNKIIWQEYNPIHFRNEVYIDNIFTKVIDNTVSDMKYPQIYNSMIAYVGDDKYVRLNTQKFSDDASNATISSGSDSCFYPVFVDSVYLSIGTDPKGGRVYIENTKIRALWVEGHNNNYRIEFGGASYKIYTDSIGDVPNTVFLTDTLTNITESALRNYLPSSENKQPIEILGAVVEGLNPEMDYLLEVISTNNNKNQPYALLIEGAFEQLIEGKETTTVLVIDESDYSDGYLDLDIERVKGNPNRTIAVNLYEYDKIDKEAFASQNRTLLVSNIDKKREEYSWNLPRVAGNTIECKFILPESGITQFKIYDIMGREVYFDKQTRQKGVNEIKVNSLSSGVYFYLFESKYGIERGKIAFIR